MSAMHDQLKALIEEGLTFSECVQAFGVPSIGDKADPFAAVARSYAEEGVIEVDDITVLSESEEGCYVMAWLWVEQSAKT